jgi:hypothetical protein
MEILCGATEIDTFQELSLTIGNCPKWKQKGKKNVRNEMRKCYLKAATNSSMHCNYGNLPELTQELKLISI